jgi:predicted nucleic acid-binding protein
MAHHFFETSALVKPHVIEAGSRSVKSLVRAKAAHTIYIVRITAVEVTSAITRRQHAGHLSGAQVGAILGHFRRQLTEYDRIIELTPALFAEAMLTARKHRLRAYDAACSHDSGCVFAPEVRRRACDPPDLAESGGTRADPRVE